MFKILGKISFFCLTTDTKSAKNDLNYPHNCHHYSYENYTFLSDSNYAISRRVPSFCLDIFSSLILIFILAYQFQILKYFLCHY